MSLGRPAKYPWDVWLDGKRHTVQPNVDYDAKTITPETMRKQILLRARKEGKRIVTEIKSGWILIEPASTTIDWDKLFEKSPAVCEMNVDFHTDVERFVANTRAAAARRGLRCKIQQAGTVVTIQSWKPPSAAWTTAARVEEGVHPLISRDDVINNTDPDA